MSPQQAFGKLLTISWQNLWKVLEGFVFLMVIEGQEVMKVLEGDKKAIG